MQLVHGGDWAGYRAEFGRDALDFSANVSPLGLPEGVARAITAALPTADRYPDPLCRELRAKLVLHEGVLSGAHPLRQWGGRPYLPAGLGQKSPAGRWSPPPTFAEYATALESVGCTVERFFCGSRRTLRSRMRSVRPSVRGWIWCSSASPITPPASWRPCRWWSRSSTAARRAAPCWWWTNASLISCPTMP